MTSPHGYPHDLAGEPAPPPEQVDRRVLGMALKAHARHLAAAELTAAGKYRRAYCLDQLVDEANAAAPHRNTASDGWIGDARHQDEGSGSDHNPWVIYAGQGIVRAEDLTNDPALELPAVFERMRAAAAAGRLPQLVGGGFLILAGRITAEDWSGWRVYKGDDPHVSHGHVSTSLAEAAFDSRSRWGVFSNEQPVPAPPAPSPGPGPAGFTGPDLTGSGAGLRGQAAGQPQGPQSNGPRVAALQSFLNRYAPAYSSLKVDGWYGVQTAAVLRELFHRVGIPDADGLNIGPKGAAALYRVGFDRKLSAAVARAVGHVNRTARR